MTLKPAATGLAILAVLLTVACHRTDPTRTKSDAIRRGDDFVQKGQYADAVSAYLVAVKTDPMDGEVRLKLAGAYRLAKQWGDAPQEFIRAADLLPDNRDAQLEAVEALLQLGRFIDAIARIVPIHETHPDDPRVLVLFANTKAQMLTSTWGLLKLEEALRLGHDVQSARIDVRPATAASDDRAAENAFRRALEIAPDMTDARLGFAGFLWTVGRPDEAADVLKRAADADPSHAFLSRALGLFYASRSRDTDAEKYLKAAASTGDRDSQLVLADYYLQRNRGAEVLPILDKMAAGNDPDGAAALRAAEVEFGLGKPEQAMQRAEGVLARDPRNARALRIKAQVLLAAKDFSQAMTVARAAVAAEPGSREARLVLARSLAATGDAEGAFTEFTELARLNPRDAEIAKERAGLALTLGRDGAALEIARQAVQLDPTDRDATIALVRALVRNRDFPAADRTLAPLLAGQSPSSDALVLLGAIQAARGSNDAARGTYLHALQADPDSLEALSALVALEIEDHQAARVRPRVDQAVSTHPKDPGYLLLAVRVSRAEGDAPRAESMLRTILGVDPGHVEAGLLLADILARQNRRDEATRVIEQVLTRRPSSFELQVSLANLLEENGHIPEARTRYEQIVAANSKAFAVSSRLATLYANQDDNLDKALELATAAKQQLPSDPNVNDALGWVYVHKGLVTLGMPYLESAARAEPASALFRYHLGSAHARSGEFQQAREDLTRALGLDPNFPGASDARATLNTLAKSLGPPAK